MNARFRLFLLRFMQSGSDNERFLERGCAGDISTWGRVQISPPASLQIKQRGIHGDDFGFLLTLSVSKIV